MDRNSLSVDLRRVSPHVEAKFASVSSMEKSRIILVFVTSVEVRCEEGNNNEGEDCAMLRKMHGTVLVGHKGSLGLGVERLLTPQAP